MYNDVKIPGYNGKMDGKFTLAENIADNEGVKLAFKVHQRLGKKFEAEGRFGGMQDFNNDQMFFLGYAITFCNKRTNDEKYIREQVLTDSHSPEIVRVNTVLANMPEFATAFHCSPASPMNPKTRCTLY
ncbi:hypothetical protein Y032_0139g2143 [Ancylostoma ceylanicum]|uniref:Peptidase M13 C-terminal domain-containing protein n=1 Tax=Ancylostoma ceylanicum TaxID=53326 RepID=A0A016T4Z0_9BILA|nr:hypothetical protein Y032_0139g2143 [Ancylostoma ceylanicum]